VQKREAREHDDAGTAAHAFSEVRRIIDEQYERARTLLAERQQVLREAAGVLLNKEVLTGEELRAIAVRGGQAAHCCQHD
jgi:cell division protease FtsH